MPTFHRIFDLASQALEKDKEGGTLYKLYKGNKPNPSMFERDYSISTTKKLKLVRSISKDRYIDPNALHRLHEDNVYN